MLSQQMARIGALALLAAALILLTAGCGGGEDLDDRQTTMPVDCTVQPAACK